jgi:hypothetical protein
MKFYRLHEEPNAVLASPAYIRHYEQKLIADYPGHEIIPEETCPLGYCYLVNKEKLLEEYKAIIEEYKDKINEDSN